MYAKDSIFEVLEQDLVYLGLLDKAHEIYEELGSDAAVSYVQSSYRLLSKVYHPDLNPNQSRKAQITQQALNRLKFAVKSLSDNDLAALLKRGLPDRTTARKRILIVDDDPMVRDVLEKILTLEGYECFTAADSDTASRMWQQERPHLLLCDIVMPRIDGIELVQSLRKATAKMRVIYICGFLEIGNLRKRVEQETRTYRYRLLEKPLKPSVVLFTIDDYFREEIGQKGPVFAQA